MSARTSCLRLVYVALSVLTVAACSNASSPVTPAASHGAEHTQDQPEAKAQRQRSFSLLFINDLHGHYAPFEVSPGSATSQTGDPGGPPVEFPRAGTVGGFARIAQAVKDVRKTLGPGRVLLLHSGDSFSDGLLMNRTRGEAMMRLMNALDFHLMAFGNHDFDYGWPRTQALARIATFPIRGANVIDTERGQPALGDPYIVRTLGETRVAILAVGYRHTPLTTSKENVRGLQFGSGLEAAHQWVPRLRKEADFVVVLSHEGTDMDVLIARDVEGVDLIIGGHSHDFGAGDSPLGATSAKQLHGVPVVQALSHGAALGRVDVTLGSGQPVRVIDRTAVLWEDQVDEDPQFVELVARLREPHAEALDTQLAQTSVRLSRQYMSASPFDTWLGKQLVEATKAELALLPGVGYGVALTPGTISREALTQLLPHPTKVAAVTLTGAQIDSLLEQSARNIQPDDPTYIVGGLIQGAGITWQIDLDAPIGDRVSRIQVAGKPLQLNESYRVATHSGMMAGLHRYDEFAKGEAIERSERKLRDVAADALEATGVLRGTSARPMQWRTRDNALAGPVPRRCLQIVCSKDGMVDARVGELQR